MFFDTIAVCSLARFRTGGENLAMVFQNYAFYPAPFQEIHHVRSPFP